MKKLVEFSVDVAAGAVVEEVIFARSASISTKVHYLFVSTDANIAEAYLVLDGNKITPTLAASQNFALGKDKLFTPIDVLYNIVVHAVGGTAAGKITGYMYVEES
jgi:hypothetical protein